MDLSGKALFIANRGEIAVRINRTAKALGMEVVQAYSAADEEMLAVKLADRAVNIGPPHAAKSYLNIDGVVQAAVDAGADAVHPGYGFLSENAKFADAVETARLTFIGPRGETIARMGDKVAARESAKAAGVPTVPGSDGRLEGIDEATALAEAIGYPLMIKAAAGGGGRGIRVVESAADLAANVSQASTEARAAFGDGGLYIERLVPSARHVEVQVIGDGTRAIHVFERECSLQRRRQKVWEEAPALCLSDAEREAICAASVRLAEAVNYRGAGTLEYLYDPARGEFYFLEMNTRIQVEHPVTEMITGLDLIAEQIRVCFGAPLSLTQDQVAMNGHAIEVRVNAEDPAKNFLPFPGQCAGLSVPADARFDTMLYEGYQVPPFYDSLLGKLIVHAPDRASAIAKLRTVIDAMRIDGLTTTLPLHAALARDASVLQDAFDTRFLEGWLENNPINAATAGKEV